MNKQKRAGFWAVFLAVTLFFNLMVPSALGQGLDIELENYWTTKSTISTGDQFTLTMTIKNISGEAISDIYLSIDSDSFFVKDQGSQIFIAGSLEAGGSTSISLDMVYSGGSAQIPFKFKYCKGETELEVLHTIGMVVEEEQETTTNKETQVTGDNTPIIKIAKKETLQASAGTELEAKLQIKNMSSHSAKDVLVSASFEDMDSPFTFIGEQIFYLRSMSNQSSKTVVLNIQADNTAKAGTYALKLDYQFSNKYGENFTSSENLYIKVTNDNAPPRLMFTPRINQGQILTAGEEFNLMIGVVNRGGLKARDISIDLTGLSSDKMALSFGSSRQYINQLAVEEERTINYLMKPASDISDGSYPVTIAVKYQDEIGTEYTDTQEIFLSIGAGGSSVNGAPKIIVNRYESTPVIIKAGENFTLNMSFLNTHGSKTVQNIKVVLSVSDTSSETGSVFTPVNSSNTFYIDKIEPQQAVQKSLQLYTIPDASPRTYSIDTAIEYEDGDGKEYTTNELIGIPVKQITRLDISDIQIYGEGMTGQPVPISCEFYNTGRTVLRNLIIKVEGDFEVEGGSVFIGNMNTGSSDYFDGTIIPSEAGTLTGNVVFLFEDVSGEPQLIKKEFTLEVMDFQPVEPFPGEEYPGGDMNSGNQFKIWYVIIPIAIIGTGIFLIIRHRKKKNEEEMIFDD